MSEALITKRPATGPAPLHYIWRLIVAGTRTVARVFLAPLRLFMAVRRSMTVASVSVLLVSVMTLNIIWGYPWTGMFAACVSLLVIGFAMNHWMRPRLSFTYSLPAQTPAGQPCDVVMHCASIGRLPALDFALEHPRNDGGEASKVDSSTGVSIGLMRPKERVDINWTLIFHQRGMQPMPPVLATTTFPFHLFRNRQSIAPTAIMAVTPAPLCGDEDSAARSLLHAVGGWSHKLLAGDALDYTGSREYQPGMPVRRWDFPSWARLGRPIVREYQAPSVQSVLLIIDTALSNDQSDQQNQKDLIERALSLAATTINDLTNKSVRVQLYVTSETPPDEHAPAGSSGSTNDTESLLIQLAAAKYMDQKTADRHLEQFMAHDSGSPTLLLTARSQSSAFDSLHHRVCIISVDQPDQYSGVERGKSASHRIDSPHITTAAPVRDAQALVANGDQS